MIDADSTHGKTLGTEYRGEIGTQGLARLGAEALHLARRVVAAERGQIDAGNGFEKPGGLPFLLDRAAGGEAGVAKALDIIRTELAITAGLTGLSDLSQVTPAILQNPQAFANGY